MKLEELKKIAARLRSQQADVVTVDGEDYFPICPQCGSALSSSTYVAYIGEDLNTLTCSCGWSGTAREANNL